MTFFTENWPVLPSHAGVPDDLHGYLANMACAAESFAVRAAEIDGNTDLSAAGRAKARAALRSEFEAAGESIPAFRDLRANMTDPTLSPSARAAAVAALPIIEGAQARFRSILGDISPAPAASFAATLKAAMVAFEAGAEAIEEDKDLSAVGRKRRLAALVSRTLAEADEPADVAELRRHARALAAAVEAGAATGDERAELDRLAAALSELDNVIALFRAKVRA